MKKTLFMLFLLQSVLMNAQTKTIVTQYGEKIAIHPNADNGLTLNNGSLQLGGTLTKPTTLLTTATNTIAFDGLVSSTNANDTPVVAATDGTLKTGTFPAINIVPADIGTVIVVNGKLEVAQEITALMTAPFYIVNNSPTAIGYIQNVLIDNKGTFVSSNISNSFTVTANGVYLVTINAQIYNKSAYGGNPFIGLYCDTDSNWVAQTNYPNASETKDNFNLTLLVSIPLSTAKTYSFRATTGTDPSATVRAIETGSTGSGPVSFFSVRRLK